MVSLPASGAQIALRDPGGAEELLLHESHSHPIETALALLARRQIGGYSGDVLGALQQICEIAILLTILAHP